MSGTCALGVEFLEVDKDRRLAGGGVALHVIEAGRLLQLALDAVGDLLERVADRGARPLGLHHHGLDGEVRVLAAPEPEIGRDAGDRDHQHEVGHQRAVPEGPFGEVEAAHDAPPSRRTFWPGRSTCTPAVTTTSLGFEPLRDHNICRVVAHDIDVAQRHGLALRIDHPHRRTSVRLGERAGRDLNPGGRGKLDAAGDGGAQPHGVRRIDNADFDLVGPGSGIRLRRRLPHAAGGLHIRIVGQRDLHHRVARAGANELLGHVEDGVASALARELHDHLARLGPLRPVRRQSR